MPYEPVDEPALNVIYNFDIDKSADSERLDGGPSRSDSDVAPNESHGYNLRPVSSYSVYRRIQEEEDSHGAWRESTRAARKPTPYMRARVSPGPSTTGYSADRPDPREISTKSNEPGRTTVQSDAVRGEASVDGLRGKEPSVLCISSDSSDGEDEKEDDGVPAEQKSPVRVYKVFRAPSPKPAGRRARGVTEPLRVMKKAHNDRYSHKHKNQLIRPAPRNGQTPQAPHALIEGVRDIREDYPHDDFSAGYTHLRDGQIKWGIRCLSCPNAPLLSTTSVGVCVYNFRRHLDSLAGHVLRSNELGNKRRRTGPAPVDQHVRDTSPAAQARPVVPPLPRRVSSSSRPAQPPPARAPPSSTSSSPTLVGPSSRPAPSASARVARCTSPRAGPGAATDVEDFLRGVGLSPELATQLRRVGVSDRARMRALGGLPDEEMDRLDRSLAKAGLDDAARILVRCGLRKCAAT